MGLTRNESAESENEAKQAQTLDPNPHEQLQVIDGDQYAAPVSRRLPTGRLSNNRDDTVVLTPGCSGRRRVGLCSAGALRMGRRVLLGCQS